MSLLDTASLIVTPNGYKAGTLYSVIPNTTLGDLSVTRATTATRVNSSGLIESVASNVPRLDYTNGSCPSILVEPQRTNTALYSETFTNSYWVKGNSSVTSGFSSPSGNLTATKLTENTLNTIHQIYSDPILTSINTDYLYSIYLKKGERNWVKIQNGSTGAFFNLDNGTIGLVDAGSTAYIQDAGDGWYRCSIKFNTGVGVSLRVYVRLGTSNGSFSYLGDGTSGAYIWGAQFEAGSYATSYIPTTSASVTRNADQVNKTGISSLIGQTEGTIFFNGILNNCEKSYANILNGERNNNASFSIIYVKSTNSLQAFILSNGMASGYIAAGYFLPGQRVKIAYSYKSGSSVLYLNGNQIGTSSQTFTLPNTIDDLYINDSVTYSGHQESVSNYVTALWKTKLTTAQLAQLTTL
jgi:hypothetical protein